MYEQGGLVYVKDFRLLAKKKFQQRFYSAPFLILRSYDHSLLVRDFFGLTKLVHKDNVRPCPVREAYLFKKLPITVKRAVGFEFDTAEIEQAILTGKVPEFWNLEPEPYERPVTRSQSNDPPALLTADAGLLDQQQLDNQPHQQFSYT